MRSPRAEGAFIVVCEDIRQETSLRLSLMGILGPYIDVPALPGVLPCLGAVMFLRNPEESLTTVTMTLFDPIDTIMGAVTQAIVPVNDDKQLYQFQIKAVPLPILMEGRFLFRFTFNGADEIGLETSLHVRKRPAPTAP